VLSQLLALKEEEAFGSSLFLPFPLVTLMFALSEIITHTTEPSQKLSNPHFHYCLLVWWGVITDPSPDWCFKTIDKLHVSYELQEAIRLWIDAGPAYNLENIIQLS
jgi:hypothetical protein